jgi:disulfide bond formation protein DsbB
MEAHMKTWRETVFIIALALTLVINLIVEWRRKMEECPSCGYERQRDMSCNFCGTNRTFSRYLTIFVSASLLLVATFIGFF